MSRARRKQRPSAATSTPSPYRRLWMGGGVFVLSLACWAAVIAYRAQHTNDAAAAVPTPEQQSPGPVSGVGAQQPVPDAQREKLVGRWRRADANYVLDIRTVAADGQIDAAYLNPRPVHVSQSRATSEAGKINVMVELRDRLYPGSYYMLVYDPSKDQLSGVYHHLGVHQDFDAVFTRIGGER